MLCIATLVVSTVFYLVNIGLLAADLRENARAAGAADVRGTLGSTTAPFAMMASLAVILVVVWDRSPSLAVALAGPLAAIALYERGSTTRSRGCASSTGSRTSSSPSSRTSCGRRSHRSTARR